MPIITIDDNIKYLLYHDSNALQSKPAYISPDRIPEGERNGVIFKFACMMQAKGASDSAVFAATMAENESKCCPPLSEKEVALIVSSALKYEKGKPIYIQNDGTAIQGQREPIFELDKKGFILKTWDNTREAIEYDAELYGKSDSMNCSKLFLFMVRFLGSSRIITDRGKILMMLHLKRTLKSAMA